MEVEAKAPPSPIDDLGSPMKFGDTPPLERLYDIGARRRDVLARAGPCR
jgi:hypothetical protein